MIMTLGLSGADSIRYHLNPSKDTLVIQSVVTARIFCIDSIYDLYGVDKVMDGIHYTIINSNVEGTISRVLVNVRTVDILSIILIYDDEVNIFGSKYSPTLNRLEEAFYYP